MKYLLGCAEALHSANVDGKVSHDCISWARHQHHDILAKEASALKWWVDETIDWTVRMLQVRLEISHC